jgi:hypothetical protein
MKQFLKLGLIIAVSHFYVKAQTNTFPTTGSVGIGTTTPEFLTEIRNDNSGVSLGDNTVLALTNHNYTLGTRATLGFKLTSNFISAGISGVSRQSNGAADLDFFTVNSAGVKGSRMFISSQGNIGIGTTSPTNKLQIGPNNAAYSNNDFIISNSNGTTALHNDVAEYYMYSTLPISLTSNGARALIAKDGSVGIGNTSLPLAKLHLTGATALATQTTSDVLLLERPYSGGVSFGRMATFALGSETTSDNGAGRLDIKINPSESSINTLPSSIPSLTTVMTLLGSGNVGIGTATPVESKLDVIGVIRSSQGGNGGCILLNNSSKWGTGIAHNWRIMNNTNGLQFAAYDANGCTGSPTLCDTKFTILDGGNVGIGTTAPGALLHVSSSSASGELLRLTGANGHGFKFLASGSVPFAQTIWVGGGEAMAFSINNAEAMRINTDGNIGIGTAAPANKLQVGTNPAGFGGNDLVVSNSNGSFAIHNDNTMTYMVTNARNMLIGANGVDALFIKADGKIGIGTTNPQAKLAVNGDVYAKKIKVTQTGWSDFVFEVDYKLRPLSEVESFIKQHKHLPEVPSADEVAKNDLDLGQMNKILLMKVEELTLYLLKMEKENQEVKARLNALENAAKN